MVKVELILQISAKVILSKVLHPWDNIFFFKFIQPRLKFPRQARQYDRMKTGFYCLTSHTEKSLVKV